MIKLLFLKLDINTTNGLYGTTIPFSSGLNIIRANNTSGKSTIFQSILYALGFEELIGGRNEKTMQSVLRDAVLEGERYHKVTQSTISLQLTNGKQVTTIMRSVVNEKRKPQLVDVIFGPYISDPDGSWDRKQMYLHDPGSASDLDYGFHSFLEEYLGWRLPDVLDYNGNSTKLYLPLIAPAFIVEQKSGWSSLFATMPYYSVKRPEERVVEFLLDLEVFQNEQLKIELNTKKRVLAEKWSNLYQDLKKAVERGGGQIHGLPEQPEIINNTADIFVRIYRKEQHYRIPELIKELQSEFENLQMNTRITVGENLHNIEERLADLSEKLVRYNLRYEQMESETHIEREQLKQYIRQKRSVEEDLSKNRSASKMVRLGADIQSSLASHICPSCSQPIRDSLLPGTVDQLPMQIDDNIKFLISQQKMLDVFVKGQRQSLIENETRISDLRSYLGTLRQQIRTLKKDLTSDERIPSEELIESKINTRRLLDFYAGLDNETEVAVRKFASLSEQWDAIKKDENGLKGDFLSKIDREKLKYLENYFITLLTKFKYQSKDKAAIKISEDKYVPVIGVSLPNGKTKAYDIRFDSSGSDTIRYMWAYYIALFATSHNKGGNHPGLMIFDEPQQQSASNADFHQFLNELSMHGDTQTIVFASFQNSLSDFRAATNGISYHLIESAGKFVTLIEKATS